MHAANPEIVGMHAGARGALVKYHELFALFKTPQRRRQGANVHRLGGNVEQIREQPSDLAIQHADQLASSGNRDAKQLFGRQAERMFLVHRRNIVEPIEVGQRLQVGFMLDQFFGTAMEQTDMGIDAPDYLTVEFQDEAQHPVRRRMLRSKIDREIAERSFGHVGPFRLAAIETPCTFSCSAAIRTLCAPSPAIPRARDGPLLISGAAGFPCAVFSLRCVLPRFPLFPYRSGTCAGPFGFAASNVMVSMPCLSERSTFSSLFVVGTECRPRTSIKYLRQIGEGGHHGYM